VTARIGGSRRQAGLDHPDEDEVLFADGLMGRIVDRILENPAMSGGLIVMALTAAAVVSNALFLQKAQHPEPWFATRPPPAATAPSNPAIAVPDPRPRAVAALKPPVPRPAPDPEAIDSPGPAPSEPALSPAMIADLQRALSARGLYRGKIDGIPGSRTRAAITAYEKSQGLPVTGRPSPAVLDHIVTASVSAAPPVAGAAKEEPQPPAEAMSITPPPVANPAVPHPAPATAPAAVAPAEAHPAVQPHAEPAAQPAPGPDGQVTTVSLSGPAAAAGNLPAAERTLAIQQALNRIGYGPVPEDGVAGQATVDAIRRFELDNGLAITGIPGDAVVERLTLIGALDAA
jgi:peptidoglycan hydrolase-like protein with peptidoglycan-binding domain